MRSRTRNILLTVGALLILAVLAVFSLQDGMSVMVDGESVGGLAGAGYAVGGVLIGFIATCLALLFVSLVLTGVSIFVMVVLALVFFGVLVLLSPLVLPLALVVGLVWMFSRKKTVAA